MNSLAHELRHDYDEAHHADGRVTSAILFGIRHSEELRGVSLRALVTEAGLPPSYATEVRKGVRLAAHVVLAEEAPSMLAKKGLANFDQPEFIDRPKPSTPTEAKPRSFASFLLAFPGLEDHEPTNTRVRDLDL